MEKKNKIYFASDCHLGVPNHEASLKREKHFVKWLENAAKDASEIYLLGDLFDFWFEYRTVVPKGFTRLLGCLSRITDNGTPIYFFTGNHDMWCFDYLEKECGLKIYRHPIVKDISGKRFMIGHGDGLGKGDFGYKLLKGIFANKLCQKLFAMLHPSLGIGIALYFSHKSRIANGKSDEIFLGEEGERLIKYCMAQLEESHYDFFIFGHRHLPLDIKLNQNSRYINTGEWVKSFSYAVFDESGLRLEYDPIG